MLKKVEKLCNEASVGEKVSSGTISATFPYLPSPKSVTGIYSK
jgi:hypothetical protein